MSVAAVNWGTSSSRSTKRASAMLVTRLRNMGATANWYLLSA